MRHPNSLLLLALTLTATIPALFQSAAQSAAATPVAASAPTAVPNLVRYSGLALNPDGKPKTGESSITFLIYKDEQGGDPLWVETQTPLLDSVGHYQVHLGAMSPHGLPSELFATGEARWLEVQVAGVAPSARVLLASVPYALNAATLGGLPASAFVLAGSQAAALSIADSAISPSASSSTVTTTGGTSKYLPVFTGTSTIGTSEIYDTGTSVGIGDVPNAGARLDVNGAIILRGSMTVARIGNATSSKAYGSHGFEFYSNVYNSSTKATDNPYFQLQSEPTGSNSSSTGATFNFLYSNHGNTPAETGLSLNSSGVFHFATGQTFGSTSSSSIALDGTSNSNTGVAGNSTTGNGVVGITAGTQLHTAGVYGVAGTGNTSGFNGIAAVWGDSSNNAGVFGSSDNASGVVGQSYFGNGVQAQSAAAAAVYAQSGQIGVEGLSTYASGIYGSTTDSDGGNDGHSAGVEGYSTGADPGVYGVSGGPGDGGDFTGGYGQGVQASDGAEFYGGESDTSGLGGRGIYVRAGINGSTAAQFDGDVFATGTFSNNATQVKIDHPLDPANKYLVHAAVESSENMNIYTGNVITDELGIATVHLPDWFEAENGDFRYQLTVIGRQAQTWIAEKINHHQFRIGTNAGHVEISWQVSAIRQDAYAKANPLVVEPAKNATERGFYQHPELYGQPQEKQSEWGRNPEKMRRNEIARKAQRSQSKFPVAALPVQARVNPAAPK